MIRPSRVTITDHTHRPMTPCARPRRVPQGRTGTTPAQLAGLGVVANPDGSYYVPDWCSWLPFSSFNDACKPPTPAQALADSMSALGPTAKANPALVAKVQQAWSEAEAAYAAENPEDAAAYQFAIDNPGTSAAIGTGPAARTATAIATSAAEAIQNAPDFLSKYAVWLIGGTAAAFGLAILTRK